MRPKNGGIRKKIPFGECIFLDFRNSSNITPNPILKFSCVEEWKLENLKAQSHFRLFQGNLPTQTSQDVISQRCSNDVHGKRLLLSLDREFLAIQW